MNEIYTILGEEFALELISSFDELSAIDFSREIDEQIMVLDEDLLQLSFKSGVIIDVGWYPAFKRNGNFIVYRITNSCWEKPERKYSVGWDKKELLSKIRDAIK